MGVGHAKSYLAEEVWVSDDLKRLVVRAYLFMAESNAVPYHKCRSPQYLQSTQLGQVTERLVWISSSVL